VIPRPSGTEPKIDRKTKSCKYRIPELFSRLRIYSSMLLADSLKSQDKHFEYLNSFNSLNS
jgi:hypothetical protein